MSQYILVDICAFNQKKQKKLDEYKNKKVKLADKVQLGKPLIFEFDNNSFKETVINVYKEEFTTGRLVIVTSSFTAIVKLNEK